MKNFQINICLTDGGLNYIIPQQNGSFLCGNSYGQLKTDVETIINDFKNGAL